MSCGPSRWATLVAGAIAVIWGLCFVLIQSSMSDSTPLSSAGTRSLLGGLALGVWVFARSRGNQGIRLPRLTDIAFLALANAVVAFGAMYLAAERATAVIASVLAGGQPILLAVTGRLVFGDPLAKAASWGLGLGLAGVILIATSASGQTSGIGVALALLSAAAPVAGTVRMRRLADRIDIPAATSAQFLIGGMVLLVAAAWFEDLSSTSWSTELVISLVILGVVGTGLAYPVWFTLLKSVSLVTLGAALFMVPLVGVVGGLMVGDRPAPLDWIGVVVILVGIALVMSQRLGDRPAAVDPEAARLEPGAGQ